jgi:hypothetical protein
MSLAAWYYHKADQCARLAKDAIEPRKRSDFETERKLWLQIAEQIEMDEVRWFGPDARQSLPRHIVARGKRQSELTEGRRHAGRIRQELCR